MTKNKPQEQDIGVEDIYANDQSVATLVSSWMDDAMDLGSQSESEEENTMYYGAETANKQEPQQEENEEMMLGRAPRVGLGAEKMAKRGLEHAESMGKDAGAVGESIRRQRRDKERAAASVGMRVGGLGFREGKKGKGEESDDSDDEGGRAAAIEKSALKRKGDKGQDAVGEVLEAKRQRMERRLALKVQREEEARKEKEAVEVKEKTGEAFIDGDDFIAVPELEPKKKNPNGSYQQYDQDRNKRGNFGKGNWDGNGQRKRTKTRSKQKNMRRDHRPEDQRPNYRTVLSRGEDKQDKGKQQQPQRTHMKFDDDE